MTDVLQSYLIQLGYKIDENGWKGFQSRVAQSAKNIAELGSISVATAAEIGVAVERVARHYEDLYYVSQRSGSTVSSLKGQAFGFRQIGLSAEQARSAVESFAQEVRMNPGVRSMFRGMGIDTADASRAIGQLVDKTKAQFGEQGYFVAARIAAMGGMDEATFKQMWDNRERLKAEEEAHVERQRRMGINVDDAARRFTEYGRRLNTVGDNFGLLKDRIALDFLPAANRVLDWVELTTTKFGEVNVATGGWAGQLAAVAVAAGSVRVALIPILALLRSLGIIGAASSRGLGLSRMAGSLVKGGGIGGAALSVAGVMKYDSQHGNPLRTWLRAKLGIEDPGEAAPWAGASANENKSDAGSVRGDLASGIARTAKNLGIDPVDLATAISYETAGTFDKWKAGPTTQWGQHRGLIQWGEPQRKKYGVTEDMSAGEQMAAVEAYLRDAGVRPGMKLLDVYSAINAGRVGKYGASDANNGGAPGTVADKVATMAQHRARAAALMGGDAALVSGGGGEGATISQRTEVNIHGVSDPKKAADLAVNAQKRVNGDLVRNTASIYH